jgi:predicted permease
MLKNHIVLVIRNLLRNKLFSFINITGLAVGLSSFTLILLWVVDELKTDRFHEKGDRIYRIRNEQPGAGDVFMTMQTPTPLAPALVQKFPEIEKAVRANITVPPLLFTVGDRRFYEPNVAFVDPEFLDVFSFELIKGDAATALNDPTSIVVTEELAAKYFDDADPMGKTVRISNMRDAVVTGVLKKLPDQSSFRFDFMLPFVSSVDYERNKDRWGNNWHSTFILLKEGTDVPVLESKVRNVIKDNAGPGAISEVGLQKLSDVYLRTDWNGQTPRIRYVYMLAIIAILVLLIACINFMNLSTARSLKRSREVGLKKVVGASRSMLVRQFLTESVALSVFAFIIALILSDLLLPVFNEIAQKKMTMVWLNPGMMSVLIGITVLTGLIAGTYPAFVLSAYSPATVLKANFHRGREGKSLRQGLVIFQFTLSVFLVIATLVVFRQLDYVRSRDLGYDRENLISIALRDDARKSYESLRSELARLTVVRSVGGSSHALSSFGTNTWDVTWPGKKDDERVLTTMTEIDPGFISAIGVRMKEGRAFEAGESPDALNILINEAGASAMGLTNPVGTKLHVWGEDRTVIGVMKDFNYYSLHQKPLPLIFMLDPERMRFAHVRLAPGDVRAAIKEVETMWNRVLPAYPFEFQFVDESLDRLYRQEQRLSKIFTSFAVLAIVISCLGLFGLASYTAEQRSKEMGVRKVMGATVHGLVGLQAKDFLVLVVAANLLAWPAAYVAADHWLESFAYRMPISWTLFATAATASLAIAALTVAYQAVKAAAGNPVDVLKYE